MHLRRRHTQHRDTTPQRRAGFPPNPLPFSGPLPKIPVAEAARSLQGGAASKGQVVAVTIGRASHRSPCPARTAPPAPPQHPPSTAVPQYSVQLTRYTGHGPWKHGTAWQGRPGQARSMGRAMPVDDTPSRRPWAVGRGPWAVVRRPLPPCPCARWPLGLGLGSHAHPVRDSHSACL